MKVKKIVFRALLTLTVISSIVSGCKKADSGPNDEELLVGRWKIISATYKVYTNNVLTSTQNETLNYNTYTIFRADGTYTIDSQNPLDTYIENGLYFTPYDNIIVTHPDGTSDTFSLTISELTQSRLVLEETTISGNYKYVDIHVLTKIN